MKSATEREKVPIFAQSKAMLVTAKKYNETGDSKYLEFSKKVFSGLNSPALNQDGWLLGG